MDDYQKYIAYSRYARWLDLEGRRETWEETVSRYFQFWMDKGILSRADAGLLGSAVKNLEVMPSMRALMTAGPALERENIAGYNCSYVVADNQRVFAEILYVLMCGTGVGFSVESQYVSKLPPVPFEYSGELQLWVADSKLGWAEAFNRLINGLYEGLSVRT